MSAQKRMALFLPVGILLLVSGLISNRYFIVPDFVNGLLNGIGIGLTVMGLIYQVRKLSGRQLEP